MATKSKDPGLWMRITADGDEVSQLDAKKAAERLVSESFIERRYGEVGVSSLDAVPRSASGTEVAPDMLVVETTGVRLGIELVRATGRAPTGAWHSKENLGSLASWNDLIHSLIAKKNSDLPDWQVNCDQRALLVYSDSPGLSACAFELVSRFQLGDVGFDEVWLLLDLIVDQVSGELIQPALFNLSSGKLLA
jgi:hypothetical protein